MSSLKGRVFRLSAPFEISSPFMEKLFQEPLSFFGDAVRDLTSTVNTADPSTHTSKERLIGVRSVNFHFEVTKQS